MLPQKNRSNKKVKDINLEVIIMAGERGTRLKPLHIFCLNH